MKRIRAHTLSWFKRLMYKISFHTDVERALRSRFQDGLRIGRSQATCTRHDVPLVEAQPGVFICPLCNKPRPPRPGIYIEHWPATGPHGDPTETMPLTSNLSAREIAMLQEQARRREE